jgi:hypothetical protein
VLGTIGNIDDRVTSAVDQGVHLGFDTFGFLDHMSYLLVLAFRPSATERELEEVRTMAMLARVADRRKGGFYLRHDPASG